MSGAEDILHCITSYVHSSTHSHIMRGFALKSFTMLINLLLITHLIFRVHYFPVHKVWNNSYFTSGYFFDQLHMLVEGNQLILHVATGPTYLPQRSNPASMDYILCWHQKCEKCVINPLLHTQSGIWQVISLVCMLYFHLPLARENMVALLMK